MADSSLRQSQIGRDKTVIRDKTKSMRSKSKKVFAIYVSLAFSRDLPGGVIGNTWAFGAYILGSSPSRVV